MCHFIKCHTKVTAIVYTQIPERASCTHRQSFGRQLNYRSLQVTCQKVGSGQKRQFTEGVAWKGWSPAPVLPFSLLFLSYEQLYYAMPSCHANQL